MPSTDRLEEFARIIAEGSISAAARALDIPRATLSRRLSDLEEELGVRLVHRRTRSLVLTDAGKELYRRACSISSQAAEAWDAVRRLDQTPRGELHVSVSEGIEPDLFLDFLRDYPEVSLIVRKTPRYVDLVHEGIDVAIRYGRPTEPDLYIRQLTTIRTVVVASPKYLRRHGRPERAEDIGEHPCIRRAMEDGGPMESWPLRAGGSVPIAGRVATNDLALLKAAALRGEGLVLIPWPVVRDELRRGRLKTVLEDEIGDEFPVCLVHADREYIEPKVRAFVDRAVEVLPSRFETVEL
ncbi:MAG: LysR family transcriptional regulator [Myxococcota bacterium]